MKLFHGKDYASEAVNLIKKLSVEVQLPVPDFNFELLEKNDRSAFSILAIAAKYPNPCPEFIESNENSFKGGELPTDLFPRLEELAIDDSELSSDSSYHADSLESLFILVNELPFFDCCLSKLSAPAESCADILSIFYKWMTPAIFAEAISHNIDYVEYFEDVSSNLFPIVNIEVDESRFSFISKLADEFEWPSLSSFRLPDDTYSEYLDLVIEPPLPEPSGRLGKVMEWLPQVPLPELPNYMELSLDFTDPSLTIEDFLLNWLTAQQVDLTNAAEEDDVPSIENLFIELDNTIFVDNIPYKAVADSILKFASKMSEDSNLKSRLDKLLQMPDQSGEDFSSFFGHCNNPEFQEGRRQETKNSSPVVSKDPTKCPDLIESPVKFSNIQTPSPENILKNDDDAPLLDKENATSSSYFNDRKNGPFSEFDFEEQVSTGDSASYQPRTRRAHDESERPKFEFKRRKL